MSVCVLYYYLRLHQYVSMIVEHLQVEDQLYTSCTHFAFSMGLDAPFAAAESLCG